MSDAIAIVGMSCEYPDAHTPAQLWENVLAQRRAFRRLPPERFRIEDYFSADRTAPDATYSTEAALIHGYRFDRVGFRVVGSTYEVTDPAHWLALDVASRALSDAGFSGGDGLPRESTAVFVGNTLTGDFSRACNLRLRWPYVRRVVAATLAAQGMPESERDELLGRLETEYKAPFPAINEESLAGSLSNTIAGRICGHFDFKGGGYSLDGACASSLLAVVNACEALQAGRIDVAIAGGVDLSVDPFELVGFAKAGALAAREMRVFDAQSAGFWPGEGCGFVVLMRAEDSRRFHAKPYANIRGWGISSDGSGGITRPELDGQLLVLERAYRKAGYDIETVDYIEAHGTGTQVGDATELQALCLARQGALRAAGVGSIKANIGHAKAAAGAAGLIKAALTVHHRVLPPTTGCREPHRVLAETSVLQVPHEALPLPGDRPIRAGVSALGFGGINAHLALESCDTARKKVAWIPSRDFSRSAQDCELFLFAGGSAEELLPRVTQVGSYAERLSRSELTDLAQHLAGSLSPGSVRAAVVASTPGELAARLATLAAALREASPNLADFDGGLFLGARTDTPRVGFLFPGQGVPPDSSGGIFSRRFAAARDVYRTADLGAKGDPAAAAYVQPALIAASLAGGAVLAALGIEAAVAVGHSLGELAALQWGGAMDTATALRIASARGRSIGCLAGSGGTMAALECPAADVESFINGAPVVIAARNGPRQTVVSGPDAAVAHVIGRAQRAGVRAGLLNVTHAFHSAVVAPAAASLRAHLASESLKQLSGRVMSTVTGGPLPMEWDLREHLVGQMTEPVEFEDALTLASREVELFVEVGSGHTLAGLVAQSCDVPVIPLEVGGESLRGLLNAAAWAFARGLRIDCDYLFAGRFARPFDLDWRPHFFENPCEKAPAIPAHTQKSAPPADHRPAVEEFESHLSEIDLLRTLVARRAHFPVELVTDETRLLKDLNLNSMLVAEIVVRGARALGRRPPADASAFAKASFLEMANAVLGQPRESAAPDLATTAATPAGIRPWTRAFQVRPVEAPLAAAPPISGSGHWTVLAPPEHPHASRLRAALAGVGRSGTVVIVPDDSDAHLSLLLEGARWAASAAEGACFVLVCAPAAHCASFARSLHLELPGITTCIVSLPPADPRCVEWIVREVGSAQGFAEAIYDDAGVRQELTLSHQPLPLAGGEPPLAGADVVLVTGGGKGITAECALSLAGPTGATFALVGRADPCHDAELARNLARFTASGCRYRYWRADLADRDEVRRLIAEIEREFGPVTAIVHGAGVNAPSPVGELTLDAVRRTLAAKVHSLESLLAAVRPQSLRLLVTFGSIIGRLGFERNADYALANERLTALTEAHAAVHGHCRSLAIEWSAWSGVGMAEKVGLATLRARGVEPISIEEGVAMFRRLLEQPGRFRSVVVTGRFGESPTLRFAAAAPYPRFRFLENVRATPGVELIAEAQLGADTDPYLEDHIFSEQRLLPAVVALEAMAEAAIAVTGIPRLPVFESVHLDRTVAVPVGEKVTVRVVAQVAPDGAVELVLRSGESGYAFDHFRAVCRFDGATPLDDDPVGDEQALLPLDPHAELYGPHLFHTGRFRRVGGYRRLTAHECVATIAPSGGGAFFGTSAALPALGDAAARDAALHAIQACVPHRTVLPIGFERMTVCSLPADRELTVHACERARDSDTFTYDVVIAEKGGRTIEQWTGLRLKAVARIVRADPWPEPLLRPYFERRLEEMGFDTVAGVAVVPGGNGTCAIQAAAGRSIAVRHDADGRPRVDLALAVSAADAEGIALGAAASAVVGCDLEPVRHRDRAEWMSLLGEPLTQIARSLELRGTEDFDRCATRIWTVKECLIKAGVPAQSLGAGRCTDDGWIVFAQDGLRIATWIGTLRATPGDKLAFAFLAESNEPLDDVELRPAETSEFRHIVGFDESNLVGNVYFAHYLRWQESARDIWLRQHAPDAVTRLHAGDLVVRASRCDFQRELFPGNELRIATAGRPDGDGFAFEFTYLCGSETIAVGSQSLATSLAAAPAAEARAKTRAYEHRHAVTFEETQSTGLVHHLNYFRWQGSCREMFLRDFAPDIMRRLAASLCLVTKNTACEVLSELTASDDVVVRMRLEDAGEFSVGMQFEYWRVRDRQEQLVAVGTQTILVMERVGDGKVMAPVPDSLREALQPYMLPPRDNRAAPARTNGTLAVTAR